MVLIVRNPPANAGDAGDVGSIPGLGTKIPHAVCHGQGNMKEKGGSRKKVKMGRTIWRNKKKLGP